MEDERELEKAAKEFDDQEWWDEAKRLRAVYRQLEEEEREELYKYWYPQDLGIEFDAWYLEIGISSSDWRRQMRATRSYGRFGLCAVLPDSTVQRLTHEVELDLRKGLHERLRGAVWHAFAHGTKEERALIRTGSDEPELQLQLDAAAKIDWKRCPDCAELLVETVPGSGLYSVVQARLRGDRGASCDGCYRERMSADDAEVVEARARADLHRDKRVSLRPSDGEDVEDEAIF